MGTDGRTDRHDGTDSRFTQSCERTYKICNFRSSNIIFNAKRNCRKYLEFFCTSLWAGDSYRAVLTIHEQFAYIHTYLDGFGGLVVSMLASGTQVCGFKPGRSSWIFFGRKNPQYAFLRRGSKIICPMSQLCGISKNLVIYVNYGLLAKFQV